MRNSATDIASSPPRLIAQERLQMGPKTRNALVQSNPANEPINNISRGMKRARDTAAEDAQAMKAPKTSENAAIVQALPLPDGELPLDPGRRRRRRMPHSANQLSNGLQQLSEAAQEPPSSHKSTPKHGPKAPVSSPLSLSRKSRGNKLGRPNGTRGTSKKAPSKGAEHIYDVVSDSDLERRQMLPAVGDKAPKKQTKKTKTTRATSAAAQENNVEDGMFQQSTQRKRGRPRKGTEEKSPLKRSARPSTEAMRSKHQQLKEIPIQSSKKSSRPKLSQNPTPTATGALEKVPEDEDDDDDDDEEEDASNAEDAIDDEGNANVRDQNRQIIVNKNTQSAEGIDLPVLALLGQEQAWNEILEEVRKNCPDPDQNENGKKEAVHQARAIQSLSENINRARVIYQALAKGKSDENAQRKAEKDLNLNLDSIERRIRDIKEYDVSEDGKKEARRKGSEAIRDIYLRGAPDMIYLLRAAIGYRFSKDHDYYDTESIREVIRIQDMTIRLCRTAASWKAKPAVPIKSTFIKRIKSVVFPRLKDDVKKAFDKEWQRLLVAERKRNRENRQAQAVQLARSLQEEAELEAERRFEVLRRIAEDIKQTHEDFRVKTLGINPRIKERQSVSLQPRHSSHQPEHQGTLWTRAELMELLIQLQNKDSRYLPAAERYLKILNTPLLQNKLPDHIRQKALEYKATLMETLDEADFVRSIV